MKIVGISDSHTKHRQLLIPPADMIICAGDISFKGEEYFVENFISWMKDLPIKHKILILGNHELGYEGDSPKKANALKLMQESGIHYLENSEVVIDGYKIWGSPASPFFHNWEWNYQRGPEIAEVWSKIPEDTNILVTHGPPYAKLDRVEDFFGIASNQGCKDLMERVRQLSKLKAHLFGHLHLQGGNLLEVDGVKYVNCAVCDEAYKPVNKIMSFEI